MEMLWIGISVGVIIGAGILAWIGHRKLSLEQALVSDLELNQARLETRLQQMEALERDLAAKTEHVEGLQEEIAQFRVERSALETQLQERNRAIEEQRAMLDDAALQLKETFASLSHKS